MPTAYAFSCRVRGMICLSTILKSSRLSLTAMLIIFRFGESGSTSLSMWARTNSSCLTSEFTVSSSPSEVVTTLVTNRRTCWDLPIGFGFLLNSQQMCCAQSTIPINVSGSCLLCWSCHSLSGTRDGCCQRRKISFSSGVGLSGTREEMPAYSCRAAKEMNSYKIQVLTLLDFN
jgi:hypothetical protein